MLVMELDLKNVHLQVAGLSNDLAISTIFTITVLIPFPLPSTCNETEAASAQQVPVFRCRHPSNKIQPFPTVCLQNQERNVLHPVLSL